MVEPRVLSKKTPLNRHLSTNGDGTGITSFVGDYSGSPVIAYIQPASNEVINISSLLLHIDDKGKFNQDGYGAIAAPTGITNGLVIRVSDDSGVIADITNGHPIKTNADFMHLSADFQLVDFGGTDDSLAASFTREAFGTDLVLNGTLNHKLEIILNDNFTGLEEHDFIARGNTQTIYY